MTTHQIMMIKEIIDGKEVIRPVKIGEIYKTLQEIEDELNDN